MIAFMVVFFRLIHKVICTGIFYKMTKPTEYKWVLYYP
jgi:hypothetical protein